MKIIVSLSLLFFVIASLAQAATIKGKVVEAESGNPLHGATVRLISTKYGAYSSGKGEYLIENVPAGVYEIAVSLVGYETFKDSISLIDNEMKTFGVELESAALNIEGDDLSSDSEFSEFFTQEAVVTAGKRLQAVQEVPISVGVVSKKSIDDRGITELDQALVYVPGVNVNGDQISIRGSSGFALGLGSRISLLINGFPLLSGDSGDMKFDAAPMYNVERVEVVKGAGSALYGTSALGGVINVITERPSVVPEIKARAFYGGYTAPKYDSWKFSNNYQKKYGAEASYSRRIGDFSAIVSGNYLVDQSWRKFDDSYKTGGFALLDYDFSDKTRLEILGNYVYSDAAEWVYWNSLDSATRPPTGTDLTARVVSTKLASYFSLRHFYSNRFFSDLRGGIYRTNFFNNYAESNPEYRESLANSYYLELQNNIDFDTGLFLTGGATFTLNSVDSRTYGQNRQTIGAFYAQAEVNSLENFILTLGARADYETTTDAESNLQFSPKFGALFEVSEKMTLRASVGRGFRAPTVGERYATAYFSGFEVVPNLDLKPERSVSYETGAKYALDFLNTKAELDLAIFQNDMYDLIEADFVEGSDSRIKFQNITRARIRGAELTARTLLFKALILETALTAMDPVDLTLDKTLDYRSKFIWKTGVIVPAGQFEFQADYRFLSEPTSIDETLKFQVKDADAKVPVHVVDARFIFDAREKFDLPLRFSLNARNLFDYYYVNPVGSLGETRSVTLQLDFNKR